MNRQAFVWRASARWINRISLRCKTAKPAQPRLRLGHSIISGPSSARWQWKHYLPNTRATIVRILRQQFVQKGRSASRHTRDEDRTCYRPCREGCQLSSPCLMEAQASFQEFQKMASHQEPAQGMEVGFLFQTVDQRREGRFERRV